MTTRPLGPRYIVRARTEFSAAHVLHGYPGACDRVHGHNFKVELEVEASALDEVGMAIDFTMLEVWLAEVAAAFDHRLLNDVPPFDTRNPTAENLAAHFWAELQPRVADLAPGRDLALRAVTVSENDRTSVTFLPPAREPRATP